MKVRKNQDLQRQQIRVIKAMTGLTSRDIAEEISINLSTFNNWLSSTYNFGDEKIGLINDYIMRNKGE